MRFGFVGLGQMGAPMAANLAKNANVVCYNRSERGRLAAQARGLAVAGDLAELEGCDCVILCLPSGDVVEELLFGEPGLAARLGAGSTIVDASTIEYARTLSIAERLGQANLGFVDAPVSGMRARAEEGALTMMCGGDAARIEALRAPFAAMASTILHMGPVGSGQLAKLVNQLLFDVNAAALAEILPLAAKLGLDPSQVGEVVNSGTGRSYASEFFIPRILEGAFCDGYPMRHAYKDLVSGAEISARHCVPTPVLAAATVTYQQALLGGHGAKDKGGMIRVYEDLLDVAFRKGRST